MVRAADQKNVPGVSQVTKGTATLYKKKPLVRSQMINIYENAYKQQTLKMSGKYFGKSMKRPQNEEDPNHSVGKDVLKGLSKQSEISSRLDIKNQGHKFVTKT